MRYVWLDSIVLILIIITIKSAGYFLFLSLYRCTVNDILNLYSNSINSLLLIILLTVNL